MKYLKLFEEISKPVMSDILYKKISKNEFDDYLDDIGFNGLEFTESDIISINEIPHFYGNFTIEWCGVHDRLEIRDLSQDYNDDFECELYCYSIGDDWYLVEDNNEREYYICDTKEGLSDCISNIFFIQ